LLPEYTLHNYKTSAHKIEVKGKGNTPPKISWAHISGDNIIQAKFTMVQKTIEVELKDAGIAEDRVEGNNAFSKKIPKQKFDVYRVVLEALEELPDNFVLHQRYCIIN